MNVGVVEKLDWRWIMSVGVPVAGVGSGGSEKLFSGEIRFKFDPLFLFHILHEFIDTRNLAKNQMSILATYQLDMR